MKQKTVFVSSSLPPLQYISVANGSQYTKAVEALQYKAVIAWCYTKSMRYMGIDMGKKNIGIALSDENGVMAFPKAVLPNNRYLFTEILSLIDSYDVDCIVFGESKDYSGKENPIMKDVYALKAALERKVGVDIDFEPEFLTSEEAKRTQGEGRMLDASAAAIILQSYIEKKRISGSK